MDDSIGAFVFQVIMNGVSSPVAEKIAEAFGVGHELRDLLESCLIAQAQAQAQAQEDINGGLNLNIKTRRRISAYEDEDLLNSLAIGAASFVDSGEEEIKNLLLMDLKGKSGKEKRLCCIV